MSQPPDDAITFAEKALALLDQGAFTATYKYAVLLALVDVCLEGTDARGAAPTRVHPRDLAERVIELYWPHTSPYGGEGETAAVLRQSSAGAQAQIVRRIRDLREQVAAGQGVALTQARLRAPHDYAVLVDEVAWKLVQMPLPRLQRFGRAEDRFLYDLDWDEHLARGAFEGGKVDPHLRLRPGVGDHLVRLAGLLRPLVQRQWTAQVIALNRRQVPALEQQDDLEGFLFGRPRAALAPVRDELRGLQERACFYCAERLRNSGEVDHFLPWSRHPDDGIHNLVVAHSRCNNRKRDFFAATPHVAAWSARFHDRTVTQDLEAIASSHQWPHHPGRTLSVARAVYLRLHSDARLWLLGDDFARPEHAALATALGALHRIDPAAEEPGEYDPDPADDAQ